jgi:hypothetical protein
MTDYEYGDYTLAQCCTECGYANNHPDFEVRVCPKCGGDVEMTRGRWKYIEIKNPWWAVVLGMGYIERTEKHRGDFVKKSDEKSTSTPDEDLRGEKFALFALSDEQIEKIKSTPPLSDEDRAWLGMRPVGKEFGSATFDDNDIKTGGWSVTFGTERPHAPKIQVHTSAGDPENILWQAAAILVLAGYKDATGFGVERGGDGRYYLIPNTLDPRGIKSHVMPFAYTEEGFEQFATIERYIRDPKNGFGLWETAESCFTIPTVLGLNPGAEIVYQWRQEILKECLSVMADRYYD